MNNAAFQQHANDISDISDQHFDRTLKTNLYYMARAAVSKMKSGGAIVMNGSVAGLLGELAPLGLLNDQGCRDAVPSHAHWRPISSAVASG